MLVVLMLLVVLVLLVLVLLVVVVVLVAVVVVLVVLLVVVVWLMKDSARDLQGFRACFIPHGPSVRARVHRHAPTAYGRRRSRGPPSLPVRSIPPPGGSIPQPSLVTYKFGIMASSGLGLGAGVRGLEVPREVARTGE